MRSDVDDRRRRPTWRQQTRQRLAAERRQGQRRVRRERPRRNAQLHGGAPGCGLAERRIFRCGHLALPHAQKEPAVAGDRSAGQCRDRRAGGRGRHAGIDDRDSFIGLDLDRAAGYRPTRLGDVHDAGALGCAHQVAAAAVRARRLRVRHAARVGPGQHDARTFDRQPRSIVVHLSRDNSGSRGDDVHSL